MGKSWIRHVMEVGGFGTWAEEERGHGTRALSSISVVCADPQTERSCRDNRCQDTNAKQASIGKRAARSGTSFTAAVSSRVKVESVSDVLGPPPQFARVRCGRTVAGRSGRWRGAPRNRRSTMPRRAADIRRERR